jgi:hypothetical protein
MSSINTKCIDILETIYTMGKLRGPAYFHRRKDQIMFVYSVTNKFAIVSLYIIFYLYLVWLELHHVQTLYHSYSYLFLLFFI